MAHVTNIIISASLYGSQEMFKAQLDAYTQQLHVPAFVQVDKCTVGGDNCLRADLFIAAIKNLPMESFVHFFKSLHYQDREQDQQLSLQVFIKKTDDPAFSVYTQNTIDQLVMANPQPK